MGDANLDGVVDGADFVMWRKHQGTSTSDWRDGDFNGDGTVNMADYNLWRTNFGHPAPGSGSGLAGTSVPEPQTCALLAMATIGIATSRARNLMRRR